MKTKTEAFASFGSTLTNPQWSWSATTADSVVLSMWNDKFDFPGKRYDGSHDAGDEQARGNKERLKHLIWARDHCDGLIKVVMVKKGDNDPGGRRTIAECYPRPDLKMRLTEINEQTGEFRAELVGSELSPNASKRR